ncbi:hypothetical protein [Ensifer sp. YR511]|uniref:hypothetical protein n=1 Tax=Ensifer sp. YR511 TaxID=1855294 RepID=UPI0008839A93|nr:hypothetical protein [Ensifer sp. YR511]SDO20374.1 hypothetical protein SAMN05216328_1664 [Ensifer sp. YR511]
MIISDRIFGRTGLFPYTYDPQSTFADGTTSDPKAIAAAFESAGMLATIGWSVVPTERSAFPNANYEIGICNRTDGYLKEVAFQAFEGRFKFDKSNGHCFRPKRENGWSLPPAECGFLIIGFEVKANTSVALYATNATDEELAGSHLLIEAGTSRSCVFFGPWIDAIKTTADLVVENIVGFVVPDDLLLENRDWDELARVGPGVANAAADPHFPYDGQRYLEHASLAPEEALLVRQRADCLARAQRGRVPADDPLQEKTLWEVHAEPPTFVTDRVFATDLIVKLFGDLQNALEKPDWSIEQSHHNEHLSVHAAGAYQILAHQGPIEALSLGQSVTLPADAKPADGPVQSTDEVYRALRQGYLPFPLYRIVGHFLDNDGNGNVVKRTEVAVAGLDLPMNEPVEMIGRTAMIRQPEETDQPARGNVLVEFRQRMPALHAFGATVGDRGVLNFAMESVPDTSGKPVEIPKTFIVSEPGETTEPQNKVPRIDLGSFDLPNGKVGKLSCKIFPRDRFGRWVAPSSPKIPLDFWRISAPFLSSGEVVYKADGTPLLQFRLGWDSSLRTMHRARIGLKLEPLAETTAIPTFPPERTMRKPPLPDDYNFETVPAYAGQNDFIFEITFDKYGAPDLPAMGKFPDNRVERLYQNPGTPSIAEYLITIELGTADKVLKLRPKGQRLMARVVATAEETLTAEIWSQTHLPFIQCLVRDPRPPILTPEPRKVTFTSLPLGETGMCRASLPFPDAGDGPVVVGYHVWRASELVVLDKIIEAKGIKDSAVEDFLRLIREARDPDIRSLLISTVLDPLFRDDPAFPTALSKAFRVDRPEVTKVEAGNVEIVVPAHQAGFEFVTFTAVSADGVSSAKDLKNVLRLLAVPGEPPLSQPQLRLVASDETGLFETTSLVMAIVTGPRHFSRESVRFFHSFGKRPEDPDELSEPLQPFRHLDRTAARQYVPEIDAMIDGSPAFTHAQIFLLRLAQRGTVFNVAADLKRADGAVDDVLAQIPSPRSSVQTLYLN